MLQNLWNGVDFVHELRIRVGRPGVCCGWPARFPRSNDGRVARPAGHLPGTRKNRKQNEVLQNI